MKQNNYFSFLLGFIVLFAVYHFPEFFDEFWIMAVFKIGFLLVAFGIAVWQGGKGFGAYGLALKKSWFMNLIKGLVIGIFAFALSTWLSTILGYEKITEIPTIMAVFQALPMLLLMTAIPSVAEDLLTRGYLWRHLQHKVSGQNWVLLSAAVYVLNHIWRLDDGAAVLTYLFFLGLLLAFTVWKTKNLWLAFGIHWGSNIAFESTNGLIKTESLADGAQSTWILAAVWAFIFISFLIFEKIQAKPTGEMTENDNNELDFAG